LRKKHYNIPVFLPELACPHRCVFCDQIKISGKANIPDPREVKEIIDRHLTTLPYDAAINIAFFGGSFTGLSLKLQETYLSLAYAYVKAKRVEAIRISTRPDYINPEILNLLKSYGVKTIELGAQSFDDEVLRLSQRGHTVRDIRRASKLIIENGFSLGLQMMLGLPGDTPEKAINTAHEIVAAGADNTRIYPALVLKNTALARMYKEGKYQALALDDAVELTKKLTLIFEAGKVNILRVGLHPSEELNYDKSLIAGPYHPSFKELVLSSRFKDSLTDILKNQAKGAYSVRVNPRSINYAIGYASSNRTYFNKLGYTIDFVSDDSLPVDGLKILSS
jgi:histone acetyltransferase (RNA polymerase elongator complex component)